MTEDSKYEIPPALLRADPGLPRSYPTQSYWQQVPHALANVQSPCLPQRTDIAIIGSGITGLSVSKTLLETHPSAQVTVLEARTLCSGATGRNGGQLAANAGEEYLHLARTHGRNMARRIVDFTFRNLQKMQELIKDSSEESEYQQVRKLRVFLTPEVFGTFKTSIAQMETDHPSLRGIYSILDANTVLKVCLRLLRANRTLTIQDYGIHGVAGGCLLPAGTLWPYRVVTEAFASLMTRYPSRLTIDTHTPVTSVTHSPEAGSSHPYIIHTSRGSIRATKIAYCTNGYTGHLLPGIRGLIYPFKGTMTVQDPGTNVPNQGHRLSWGIHYPPKYDPETARYAYGLYYLAQSAKTGYFYFGGENARFQDCVTADDSTVGPGSVPHLQQTLPRFFGNRHSQAWPLVSSWSGIMGFSSDGLPVVGQLPSSLTGRQGDGEWIAAAFNGYGMANCLLSGEALAQMMLGEDVIDWLPEAYGINSQRLRDKKPVKSVL